MNTPAVSILPGRNVWLLGRTDRDAPSTDSAVLTAAAWLNRLFDTGLPAPPPPFPDAPPGVSRYNLGAARPVDLRASQGSRPSLPAGDRVWSVADLPPEYGVRAQNVWWVIADFDWRGPTADFARWPIRTVGTFGWASDEPTLQADWLLLEARHVSPPTRADASWTSAAASAAAPFLGGFAGLVVLYLLSQLPRRR